MKIIKIIIFLLILPILISSTAPRKRQAAHLVKTIPKKSSPLIVVDAGHGGLDVGAKIKYPYVAEKRLTFQTALYLKRRLVSRGYRVILTRYRDVSIPLKRRAFVANKSRADLFISLHFNSCPNKKAKGLEIYYYNDLKNKKRAVFSKNFATHVLNHSAQRTQMSKRAVKKGNFYVIRETRMPAILIEGGFLTNPQEREKIKQLAYQQRLAWGIADGIDKFLKIKR